MASPTEPTNPPCGSPETADIALGYLADAATVLRTLDHPSAAMALIHIREAFDHVGPLATEDYRTACAGRVSRQLAFSAPAGPTAKTIGWKRSSRNTRFGSAEGS